MPEPWPTVIALVVGLPLFAAVILCLIAIGAAAVVAAEWPEIDDDL